MFKYEKIILECVVLTNALARPGTILPHHKGNNLRKRYKSV